MSTTFSEREMQIMANAWRCFEEQPKINFPLLAELNGFTNVGSCRNAWAAIKKKLAAAAAADGGGNGTATNGSSTPKANATPKKRGRGKKAADEDDDDQTPVKKTKKGKEATTPEGGQGDAERGALVKAESGEGDEII